MATPNIPVYISSDYDHDDDLKTLLVCYGPAARSPV